MPLLRIETPRFVAGMDIENGIVTRAAPCFKKFVGWSKEGVIKHAQKMRWKIQEVPDELPTPSSK